MNIVFLISLMIFGTTQAAEKVSKVHFVKNGIVEYGTVSPIKANLNNPDEYIVSTKKYLSSFNLSQSTKKIKKEDLTFETNSLKAKVQGHDVYLKKGMIVLTKSQMPAQIDAVFPDGKVALVPLEVNAMSRYRLKENKNFAPKKNVDPELVDKSAITAVEQKCFLQRYCAGQKFKSIEGIPLCQTKELQDKGVQGLVSCGRSAHQGADIGAVFSDGTLLLHLTLINPFPKSSYKYAPKDEFESQVEN